MQTLKDIIGFAFAGLFLAAALPAMIHLLTLTLTGRLLSIPGL